MKDVTRIILVFALAVGLMGISVGSAAAAPALVLVTPEVDLAKETKVKLKGTGFAPGQEVMILLTDKEGVRSDIGWALKPEPKAGDNGEWASTWNAKRYIQKKLIKAGEYTLSVTDADYNELDAKTIKFVGKYVKKKKKK